MSVLVKAQDLCLGYDEMVIRRVNFTFMDNDFVFITGKSGSGKSTLLKSFYGDLSPLSGSLFVCNESLDDISTQNLLDLRQRLGIIFQDYKLIKEYSIAKNVMLPLMIKGYSKKICEEQTAKLLKHVELSFKADKMPAQLSGG